jgi:hypothetical protein
VHSDIELHFTQLFEHGPQVLLSANGASAGQFAMQIPLYYSGKD